MLLLTFNKMVYCNKSFYCWKRHFPPTFFCYIFNWTYKCSSRFTNRKL